MARFVLAIAVLLLVGCGSTPAAQSRDAKAAEILADAGADGGSDDAVGTLVDAVDAPDAASETAQFSSDLNDFCGPWAALACQRAVQCGCDTPKLGKVTADNCPALLKSWCAKGFGKIGAVLQVGLVALRKSDAVACAQWLNSQVPQCAQGLGDLDMNVGPCREMLVQGPDKQGKCAYDNLPCPDGSGCHNHQCGAVRQPGGAPCTDAGQCKSLKCNDSGLCAADVASAVGGSCAAGEPCAPWSFCRAGMCTAFLPLGAACGDDGAQIPCDIGLLCINGKCAPEPATCSGASSCGPLSQCLGPAYNACQLRLAQGKSCSSTDQCAADLWCSPDAQTCTPRPGPGQPCANGTLCAAGLACNDQQLCADLPGEASPCGMTEQGPMACAPGLVCKADEFLCKKPPQVGAPCNLHGNCSESGGKTAGALVCKFGPNGGTCVDRQPLGAPCENDICQTGLFCSLQSGKCAQAYPAGTACKDGNECGVDGACVPDSTGKLRCVPMPKQGEDCLFDCTDGLFCDKGMTDTRCQPPICAAFFKMQ